MAMTTGFGPIKVVATRYRQGGRQHYIVVTSLDQLLAIVPERVDPHLIKDANRRLHEPHAKGFGDYVWDTEGWISGPVTVGVKPDRLEFEPFEEGVNAGTLSFPLELINSPQIRLVDGQHRRYGFRYFIDRETANIDKLRSRVKGAKDGGQEPAVVANLERQLRDKQNRLNKLMRESISVDVVEEDNLTDLQQIFADLAKNRPADPITVSRFDARNPFNMAAFELMEHPLLAGKIETERSRLNSSSPYMATLNQFANNVLKILEVGINGRVSKKVVAGRKAKDIASRGQQFLDDMVRARPELAQLAGGQTTVADLRSAGNLLVGPTMMRVLAGAWWEVVIRGATDTSGQDKRRQTFVDWLKTAPMTPTKEQTPWTVAGLVRLEDDGQWSTPTARMQEVRRSVVLAANAATKEEAAA